MTDELADDSRDRMYADVVLDDLFDDKGAAGTA
jgi:hypothetical protein